MRRTSLALLLLFLVTVICAEDQPPWPILSPAKDYSPLPGTALLEMEGDIAWELITGVDKFLDWKIAEAVRIPSWQNYTQEENRERLADLLGTSKDPVHVRTRIEPELVLNPVNQEYGFSSRERSGIKITRVRWQAFGKVNGRGMLLEPNGTPIADVIAIPDANSLHHSRVLEEMDTNNYASTLARLGCRVLVPFLVFRENGFKEPYKHGMSAREWIHRPAFQLGRTLAGYESNKIIAAVHGLKHLLTNDQANRKLIICGWGEGGRLALYSGALLGNTDLVDAVLVSGYFGSRQKVWKEPSDRNAFGLLPRFSDASIASLVGGKLYIEHTACPEYVFRPDEHNIPESFSTQRPKLNGKPGQLMLQTLEGAFVEYKRIKHPDRKFLRPTQRVSGKTMNSVLLELKLEASNTIQHIGNHPSKYEFDWFGEDSQIMELENHNTWALTESTREREKFFKDLDTSSLQTFQKSIEPYRKVFRDEIIGSFEDSEKYLPPNPRTRKYQVGPKTVSYEVVLDVYEDIIAYGILTLPKDLDLESGKKLPVVVCQHGLEGRPQDVVGKQKYKAYKAFATRLAEEGFITFAPQNLYIFRDKFRMLQFKANSIGKTLFSVMVPQHKVITEWLASLPYVDGNKIGFYGLSYGGKSAMRIPPLVDGYCLSICSADFNDWIWKTTATDIRSLRYTYPNKGEYEIFEFNLGNTFNYAEMAALIAPRPFMVERGHFDGVAPDERVAFEYAKVRHLYAAKLGIPDKTEIEWFVGPHSINGKGTFKFLKKHLMGKEE